MKTPKMIETSARCYKSIHRDEKCTTPERYELLDWNCTNCLISRPKLFGDADSKQPTEAVDKPVDKFLTTAFTPVKTPHSADWSFNDQLFSDRTFPVQVTVFINQFDAFSVSSRSPDAIQDQSDDNHLWQSHQWQEQCDLPGAGGFLQHHDFGVIGGNPRHHKGKTVPWCRRTG